MAPEKLAHYWICFECAEAKKGTWPEGHVATCMLGDCPYCGLPGSLAPIVDFDWPDRDLSAWRD